MLGCSNMIISAHEKTDNKSLSLEKLYMMQSQHMTTNMHNYA
jgi:hypothetical protein